MKDIKQEIRERWLKEFQPPERAYLDNPDNKLSCPLCGVKAAEISDWWLKEIDKALTAQLDRLEEEITNPSYVGVLESNEKRRGYDIAIREMQEALQEIRKENSA